MANKIAFSDRQVQALRSTSARIELTDITCRGLTIRVTPNQVKTWSLSQRKDGVRYRITLGTYPDMSLVEARAAADLERKAIHDGRPGTGRKEKAKTPKTFDTLAARYIEDHAKPNMKSWDHEVSYLKRPRAEFGSRDPGTLRRSEIKTFLEPLARDYKVTANRTQAAISRVLGWGVEKDFLPANVLAGAKRVGGREARRDRTLDAAEIKHLWGNLDKDGSPVSPLVATAIRLVLVSAQRPQEIAGLRRDELIDPDGPNPLAQLGPDRMKSGVAHSWPLSPLALTLVKSMLTAQRTDAPSRFIFPAPRDPKSESGKARGDKPITRAALSKALRRFCGHFKVRPFTTHDLRRTANSIASAEGIPIEHSERLLSHRLPGLSATYTGLQQLILQIGAMP